MKKTMKHILALVIILPFLFAGCQKSETIEADNDYKRGDPIINTLEVTNEYCGDPYVANLVDWYIPLTGGTLTIGNDANNLYAMFEAAPGYEFSMTSLYVGPASDAPGDWLDPATHTGVFYYSQFTYYTQHDPMVADYQITHDLSLLEDCFIVVGIAHVYNTTTGQTYGVSAQSNSKTYGYYFDYCKQECGEPECETAYAYGDDLATCFLDIPEVNSNNWGWSNGPISDPSSYSWDIYAGAGQCDITKGTLVGTLDVDYSGGICTVFYNIDADFTLDETHLFVGDEMLPRKKGQFTTAPGQFPYSGQSSYTIDGLSGDIYVVAHSVVCGDYDE